MSIRTALLQFATLLALLGAVVLVAPAAVAQNAEQCGGVVFHDLDANGDWDNTDSTDGKGDTVAAEVGFEGALVRIEDAAGRNYEFLTDADGSWSAPSEVTYPSRVDFGTPDGFQIAPAGAMAGMATQFMESAADCARVERGNVGMHTPSDFCRQNPDLVTACFVVGDSLDHDDQTAIVSLAYNTVDNKATDATSPADWMSPLYEQRATVGDIGSVYGIAVNDDGTVYAAAFVKRHARLVSRLNPSGNPTTIYTVPANGAPEVFATIDQSASNPHTTGWARGDNDENSMAAVYTQGLGDLQLSQDGSELYTVDLGNRQLITLDTGSGQVVSRRDLDGEAFGISSCEVDPATRPFGDLRAFGLGLDGDGQLLVGVVCSAESTVTATDFPVDGATQAVAAGDESALTGYVYVVADDSFALKLSWPLAGDRGRQQQGEGLPHDAAWHPWVDVYPYTGEFGQVAYPQPAITDIVVDARGDLVIALGDRWGHQTAPRTEAPTWDGDLRAVAEPLTSGDLLRACLISGAWVIEGAPDCRGGLGSAEFFRDDRYGIHDETSLGSVAQVPGHPGELVATHMNPVDAPDTWQAGGLIWHDLEQGTARRGVRLYDGRNADPEGTFEKASGLGGLAFDCGRAPIQFGGNVWHDQNRDGVRSPVEPAIADVIITLHSADGARIAETTSDSGGRYLFDDRNVPAGLHPDTEYDILVGQENVRDGAPFGRDGAHFGRRLTPGGRADIDAAGLASIQFVAGDLGRTSEIESNVDHGLDFGFSDRYDLALITTLRELDIERRTVSFEITVQNQGSLPSGEFVVIDELPAGVSFVDASKNGAELSPRANKVQWTVEQADELQPGEHVTFELDATIDELAFDRVNVAEIVADAGDDEDSTPDSVMTGAAADRTVDVLTLDALLTDQAVDGVDEDDHDIAIIGIGEIGGLVWSPGENSDSDNAAGVRIRLINADGASVATTQTGPDGRYVFSELTGGTYQVVVTDENFEVGAALDGTQAVASLPMMQTVDLHGSSPTGEAAVSPSATLDSASDLTVNFGFETASSSRLPGNPAFYVVGVGILALVAAALRSRRRQSKAAG